MTEPTSAAAGWYPDPAGGEGIRWWTGVTWTDDVRPSPWASATPVVPAPPGEPQPPIAPGASTPPEPAPSVPAWVVAPDGTVGEPLDPSRADPEGPTPRRRRSRWLVVGAVLVVIGLLAGTLVGLGSLTSRNKLDMAAVESDIAHRVAQRTGLVATVDCPDSVDIVAGSSFTCSVTTDDGTSTEVTVHQDDDQGNLTVSGLPQ